MRILVTGANGMLGQDLVNILNKHGYVVIPTDRDSLDITDEKNVSEFFNVNRFDIVIHAAAYTDVDGAELNQDQAFLINYKGTENIVKYSAVFNVPIVYISTDYVFDGAKNSPYEPFDKPNPINIYGRSKLMGEEAVQKYNSKHFIIRTSWLYGANGKNFVSTIIDMAQKKPELRIVSDQIGCPTWTVELSRGISHILKENTPYGIYHICGSGETSWYGFALKIVELTGLNTKVIPVSTDEFPRPASRPKYSVLDNQDTDYVCDFWNESLREFLGIGEKNERTNIIRR